MHLINRLVATLLALFLLLAGLLGVVDIVLAHLHRPAFLVPTAQWSKWLRTHTFDGGIVRAGCLGLVVLGLVLLFAALRRGRPGALTLPPQQAGVRVTASRRELQRSLATAAARVDGVHSTKVRAGRHTVRVRATTPLRDPGDLQQRVTAVVTSRLSDLGLDDDLPARIAISSKGAR